VANTRGAKASVTPAQSRENTAAREPSSAHGPKAWNRARGEIVELSNPNAALLIMVCGTSHRFHDSRSEMMFAILAVPLVIAWGIALFAFHVTGFFIRIALELAASLLIVNIVMDRKERLGLTQN